MFQFAGTHHSRLDAKGRVSVPAPFRAALREASGSDSAALTLRPSHQHECIEAWPTSTFMTFAAAVEAMDVFSEDEDDLTTTIYSDAWQMEADREGRIIVPGSLVEHAKLTGPVMFMGKGRSFQMWEPEAGANRAREARERARLRKLTIPNVLRGTGGGTTGGGTAGGGTSGGGT